MSDLRTVRRIAVFRALQLGDLIQAMPALRALRAGFPDAEITLIGLPWASSFVERFSRYIDRFVEFAGYPGIAEREVVAGQTARFLDEQRSYGYDLAIQMHGSGRTSNRFICALGARMTAGYFERPDKDALTFGAPYPEDLPEVYRNLGLAKLLGCPAADPTLEFPLDESDYAEAAALLPHVQDTETVASTSRGWGMATARVATTIHENKTQTSYGSGDPGGRHAPTSALHARLRPLIGIHAGARQPSRRWPASYFALLADELVHLWHAEIILTGSTDELAIVRAVEEQMAARPINLAGKTSLGGLAAIIDSLDLFISNDTGPAHIANALGTPSITIFGPAEFWRWAPLDQPVHRMVRHPVACSPCGYWNCPIDHRCLRKLYPRSVVEAAGDLLAKGAVV